MTAIWGRRAHDAGGSTFGEVLATIAGQGFRSLQLAPTKSLGFTHEMLSPDFAADLRAELDAAGLRVAILGSYFDLNARGAAGEAVLTRYFDHLQLADWGGFPVIGTETGKIAADAPDFEEAFAAVVHNLGVILEAAEKLGIVVAVEPVFGHTIHDAAQIERLLALYPTPHLRVIFDPVNLLDPAEEADRAEMWQDFVDRLSDRFAAVHVKDYRIDDGVKIDLPAGTGRMEYGFLEVLARSQPQLDFLIEAAPDEHIPAIRELFAF